MKNYIIIIVLILISSSIIFISYMRISNNELPPPHPSIINEEDFCGISTYGRCSIDKECVVDGCSGQVCRSIHERGVATTCEWRKCYDASNYGLSCRCVNKVCKWA